MFDVKLVSAITVLNVFSVVFEVSVEQEEEQIEVIEFAYDRSGGGDLIVLGQCLLSPAGAPRAGCLLNPFLALPDGLNENVY